MDPIIKYLNPEHTILTYDGKKMGKTKLISNLNYSEKIIRNITKITITL